MLKNLKMLINSSGFIKYLIIGFVVIVLIISINKLVNSFNDMFSKEEQKQDIIIATKTQEELKKVIEINKDNKEKQEIENNIKEKEKELILDNKEKEVEIEKTVSEEEKRFNESTKKVINELEEYNKNLEDSLNKEKEILENQLRLIKAQNKKLQEMYIDHLWKIYKIAEEL